MAGYISFSDRNFNVWQVRLMEIIESNIVGWGILPGGSRVLQTAPATDTHVLYLAYDDARTGKSVHYWMRWETPVRGIPRAMQCDNCQPSETFRGCAKINNRYKNNGAF